MIAGYGKIKRHLKNIYDGSELSELSGESLLDILQAGELKKNKITTFVVLATDYAAVGQEAKLLRDAMNQSTEKINFVLIAETEALLASKTPTNKNISIVIEKSKKADVLKKIVDRYITEITTNIENDNSSGEEISHDEVKQSDIEAKESITRDSPEEKSELKEEKEFQVTLEKDEQLNTCEEEEIKQQINKVEQQQKQQVIETKQEEQQVDKTKQEESMQLFSFPLVELPEYKPLVLNKPDDIISYLMRRWG